MFVSERSEVGWGGGGGGVRGDGDEKGKGNIVGKGGKKQREMCWHYFSYSFFYIMCCLQCPPLSTEQFSFNDKSNRLFHSSTHTPHSLLTPIFPAFLFILGSGTPPLSVYSCFFELMTTISCLSSISTHKCITPPPTPLFALFLALILAYTYNGDSAREKKQAKTKQKQKHRPQSFILLQFSCVHLDTLSFSCTAHPSSVTVSKNPSPFIHTPLSLNKKYILKKY